MSATLQKLASEAARQLSALGAAKGGAARAQKLTPEQRSAIARKGAMARIQSLQSKKAAPANLATSRK
jgi:hypothetical protein